MKYLIFALLILTSCSTMKKSSHISHLETNRDSVVKIDSVVSEVKEEVKLAISDTSVSSVDSSVDINDVVIVFEEKCDDTTFQTIVTKGDIQIKSKRNIKSLNLNNKHIEVKSDKKAGLNIDKGSNTTILNTSVVKSIAVHEDSTILIKDNSKKTNRFSLVKWIIFIIAAIILGILFIKYKLKL
jgi:hypothetical protein